MKKLMFVLTFLLCGWAAQQVTAQTKTATAESNTQTVRFKVTGMTCGGCANHVSTALGKVNGVLSEDVEYPGDLAVVKYDPAKTDEKALIAAVEKGGYKAAVLKDENTAIPHGQAGHVCSPDGCGVPAKKKKKG
jgi:periplasmic mercuric ion binding protein